MNSFSRPTFGDFRFGADPFFDEIDQLHIALRDQIEDFVEGQSLALRPTGEHEKRLRELEAKFSGEVCCVVCMS